MNFWTDQEYELALNYELSKKLLLGKIRCKKGATSLDLFWHHWKLIKLLTYLLDSQIKYVTPPKGDYWVWKHFFNMFLSVCHNLHILNYKYPPNPIKIKERCMWLWQSHNFEIFNQYISKSCHFFVFCFLFFCCLVFVIHILPLH